MKKIKLFVPIIGTILSIAPITTLVSCNKKSDTQHINLKYSEPEIAKDFVISYTIDNGYAIDTYNSSITFANLNPIYLSQCKLDTENKTITVPSYLVEHTEVKVEILSKKKNSFNDADKIAAFENLIFSFSNSTNFTLSGDTIAIIHDATGKPTKQEVSTKPSTIEVSNSNSKNTYYSYLKDHWIETVRYNIKALDFGRISVQGAKAVPQLLVPLVEWMNYTKNDSSLFVKELSFNEDVDVFIYNSTTIDTTYGKQHEVSARFNFDYNKRLKVLSIADEWTYDNKLIKEVTNYVLESEGSTTITDIPQDVNLSYTSVDTDFTYKQEKDKTYLESNKGNSKITSKLNKFSTFYPDKEIYITNEAFAVNKPERTWTNANIKLYKFDSVEQKYVLLKKKNLETDDGDYIVEQKTIQQETQYFSYEFIKINKNLFAQNDSINLIVTQTALTNTVLISQSEPPIR